MYPTENNRREGFNFGRWYLSAFRHPRIHAFGRGRNIADVEESAMLRHALYTSNYATQVVAPCEREQAKK